MLKSIFAAFARLAASVNAFADTMDEGNEKARLGMGLDDPSLDEFAIGKEPQQKRKKRLTAKK